MAEVEIGICQPGLFGAKDERGGAVAPDQLLA
jgi:hypothetical protein